MHKIKLDDNIVRTDLILEQNIDMKDVSNDTINNIKVMKNEFENNHYTTIYFDDITDSDIYNELEKVFISEFKKYIDINSKDIILVIGLGNNKSTPDSLGTLTIDNIIPTRYLFELGEVEEGYSNVSVYKPDVIGNTGIESINIINGIVKDIKPTKIIVIDSLKANSLDRLTKTIQITDSGIHPGSGINNNRGEISNKTTNSKVIAIGIPTVVDIKTIFNEKNVDINNSFIVTPTNIDFVIDKLSILLGNSLNKIFHKNFNRQKNIQ